MSEILKKVKGSGLPVAVYYKTGGAFCAGFVKEADDEFVCMQFLSPSGRHDGWHCIRIEEILKIDFGSAYLFDLNRVYNYYDEKIVEPKISRNNVLASFIDVAIKQKWLCTLEIGFESLQKISGYPVARDWNTVEMRLIDESGKDDGYTSFDVDEIVYVGAQSELEEYLTLLRKLNEEEEKARRLKVSDKKSGETQKKDKKEAQTEDDKNEKKDEKNVLSFPFGK